MAKKKSPRDPSSEFIKTLEKQRKEMEKLAKPFLEYPKQMEKLVKPFLDYQQRTEKMVKPILEYQQKLIEESRRFQETWMQNAVGTMKVINQMMEEQRRQAEEGNRLLSEASLPRQVTEYIRSLQRIQERWMEQLKKATEMIEGFARR